MDIFDYVTGVLCVHFAAAPLHMFLTVSAVELVHTCAVASTAGMD